jgi:F-type H+-transporting ATPase subunit c
MLKKIGHLISFAALAIVFSPAMAFASEGAAEDGGYKLGLALAAGFGIGIAALGGALGQGKAAAAALEGIGRNPEAGGKLFVPMILCLVFIESLVLFTFAICFILQGKI